MKHICALRREHEYRTGKPIVIDLRYSRGGILSHEEVEKLFEKALRIPFLVRAKWFLNDWWNKHLRK